MQGQPAIRETKEGVKKNEENTKKYKKIHENT